MSFCCSPIEQCIALTHFACRSVSVWSWVSAFLFISPGWCRPHPRRVSLHPRSKGERFRFTSPARLHSALSYASSGYHFLFCIVIFSRHLCSCLMYRGVFCLLSCLMFHPVAFPFPSGLDTPVVVGIERPGLLPGQFGRDTSYRIGLMRPPPCTISDHNRPYSSIYFGYHSVNSNRELE